MVYKYDPAEGLINYLSAGDVVFTLLLLEPLNHFPYRILPTVSVSEYDPTA